MGLSSIHVPTSLVFAQNFKIELLLKKERVVISKQNQGKCKVPFPHNKLRSVPQNLPRYSCNTAFIFFPLFFFSFPSSALPNFDFFSGLYLCQWGSCLKRFSFETTLRFMVNQFMEFTDTSQPKGSKRKNADRKLTNHDQSRSNEPKIQTSQT